MQGILTDGTITLAAVKCVSCVNLTCEYTNSVCTHYCENVSSLFQLLLSALTVTINRDIDVTGRGKYISKDIAVRNRNHLTATGNHMPCGIRFFCPTGATCLTD